MDQPGLQRDLKMAAGLILLMAQSPDSEVDMLPLDQSHMRLQLSKH
jgi:hypothetical protein